MLIGKYRQTKLSAFRYQFGVYLFVIKVFVCHTFFLTIFRLEKFLYNMVLHFCYTCYCNHTVRVSCWLNGCWGHSMAHHFVYCYLNGRELSDIWPDIQSVSVLQMQWVSVLWWCDNLIYIFRYGHFAYINKNTADIKAKGAQINVFDMCYFSLSLFSSSFNGDYHYRYRSILIRFMVNLM